MYTPVISPASTLSRRVFMASDNCSVLATFPIAASCLVEERHLVCPTCSVITAVVLSYFRTFFLGRDTLALSATRTTRTGSPARMVVHGTRVTSNFQVHAFSIALSKELDRTFSQGVGGDGRCVALQLASQSPSMISDRRFPAKYRSEDKSEYVFGI
jgi:hypothetical protein